MWELGNRDIIVLVSVISGLAVLCNIFGPYLAIAITFLLVLCGWFTYIVAEDETPFTPQASLALDYIEQLSRDLNNYLAGLYRQLVIATATSLRSVYRLCRAHFYDRIIIIIMSQRRRSTYQLSSDVRASTGNSSSLVDGLSPIPRNNDFRPLASLSNLENNTPYADTRPRIFERASSLDHVTSTPLLLPWKKKDSSNGDAFAVDRPTEDKNSWKNSQSFTQNHTLSRGEESSYGHEGSPWGTSISPKMRHRAAGVKTVQTVAGPLLASTRYNIDPKIYSDVTSPGLTTRLTKYATEANTKLTHQSQYGTGQFPRVNLNSSPTPLINTKTGKMRMPVTVRIAPPKSNESYSRSERQQFLSNICQDRGESQPSVVQVLREISLKRHASREDVTFELAKKQRTEDVFRDGLENLEEMTQKRGRDDSSRSEEDLSTQNKSLRPAKRSKMPSCHDILSSLSSSIAVSSGIKRKAIDVSRSGTPDVGKHFKSLDSSQGDNVAPQPLSRSVSEPAKPNKKLPREIEAKNSVRQSFNVESYDSVSHKGITKISSPGKEILNVDETPKNEKKTTKRDCQRREKMTMKSSSPVKLTDKLFMKAEPENIDKIKTLIEEHGSIKPRFTTDNTEEIKKSDIVNMRQTSMKNRLKSMFDAISGKATNTIDPQVVIQAEDKSPTNLASLSSSTFTTNVNTSPIATSAIVPIIGKAKTSTTPAKHVTFQFAGKETAPQTSSVESPKLSALETTILGTTEIPAAKPSENSAVDKKSSDAIFRKSTSPPRFPIGSSSSTSLASQTPSAIKPSVAKSPVVNAPSVPTTATPQFSSQMFDSTRNASMFTAPTSSKCVTDSPIVKAQPAETSPAAAASFSFGATKTEKPASQNPTLGETSVGQNSSVAGSKSPVTSVSSGIFEFGSASKSSKGGGFPDTSISENRPVGQLTSEHPKAWATPFPGGPTVVPRAEMVATTSQQQASSAAATTSTGSGFKFSTASVAPTIFGASSASTTSAISSTSTAPSFTFGSNPIAATAAAKPSFSFGTATSSVAATSTANTPSLSFGVTSSNATSSVFVEGSTALSSAASQPSSVFGTPSTTTTATTTTSSMLTTPSIFGTTSAQAVAQSSVFGVGATTSGGFASGTIAFGASGAPQSTFPKTTSAPSTFEAPKTMETSAFGSNSPVSSFAQTPTSSSSLFSGVNSGSGVKNPPKLPAFGDNAFNKISGPSFANNAERSSFAVTTGNYAPSIFGSQSTDAFGNAATSTSGPAPSMNTFSNVTTPSFGPPNTAAPPAFGATNNITTSFGAPTTTAATVFGAAVAPPSTFGASSAPNPSFATTTAPPAFPTLSSSGFGNSSTTPGFGTSANQSSAFNASTTSLTGFGSVSSPTAPFGAQATPENTTFGSSTSVNPTFGGNTNSGGNNNANTAFTFGASKPDSQQPQQNSVFTFGGGGSLNWANDQAANRSAPFQFNAAAPQPGGFNFTGAPTTPAINFFKDGTSGGSFTLPTPAANSFGVPPATGGMFSIGTGSTTPRSRASRRRQR